MNVQGGEGLAVQVYNPIMDLVMASHDKNALLDVHGMGDIKPGSTTIVVGR